MSKVSLLIRDDGVDRHVEKTLRSISLQTYQDIEVILFCSEDRKAHLQTYAAMCGDNKPLLVLVDDKPSFSLFAHVSVAGGEWVSCVIAGEDMSSRRIGMQVAFLKKYKHCALVGCWYFIKGDNGEIVDVQEPSPFHISLTAQLIGSWLTKEMPALVRKSAVPIIDRISYFTYYFSLLDSWTIACLGDYLTSIPDYLQLKSLPLDKRERIKRDWNECRLVFLERCEDTNIKRRLLKRTLMLFPHDEEVFEKFRGSMALLTDEEKAEDDILFLNQLEFINTKEPLNFHALNNCFGHYKKRGNTTLSALCGLSSLINKPAQRELFGEVYKGYTSSLPASNTRAVFPRKASVPVSVIIPTFNRANVIAESLDSLLKQTFEDFEVIVVNDGGAHCAEPMVTGLNDARFKYFWCSHRGIAGALNFGIERASGEYIAYLDDDDIFYPSHLETLYSEIKRNNKLFAYTNSKVVKGYYLDGKFYPVKNIGSYGKAFNIEALYQNSFISRISVMHHRSLLEEIATFNKDILWGMDWYLWLLFSRNTEPLYLDIHTSELRTTSINMSIKSLSEKEFFLKLLRTFFLSGYGLSGIAASAAANSLPLSVEKCLWPFKFPLLKVKESFFNRLLLGLDTCQLDGVIDIKTKLRDCVF